MPEYLRRAGARWRLLVHEWVGRIPGQRDGMYGRAHHVQPTPRTKPRGFTEAMWQTSQNMDAEFDTQYHVLPDTEFDELVVGHWLHVEQKDTNRWWLNVAGVTVWVRVDRDGRPKAVTVFGPGDYDEPRDGVDYDLGWTADSPNPRTGR